MNFINIAGNLGADPEVRFTSSGKKVTTLRVATKTRKSGNDDTIWYRVTVWGEQFDKMISFLKKGSSVIVFGELQKPEIFNDREGKPQISLEITAALLQFSPFGKPDREGGSPVGAQQPTQAYSQQVPAAPFGALHDGAPVNPYTKTAPMPAGQTYDDEVPF
jgi:single-strand DNA-binding protein